MFTVSIKTNLHAPICPKFNKIIFFYTHDMYEKLFFLYLLLCDSSYLSTEILESLDKILVNVFQFLLVYIKYSRGQFFFNMYSRLIPNLRLYNMNNSVLLVPFI